MRGWSPLWGVILALAWLLAPDSAPRAHEIRPASLDLVEVAPGSIAITWKQPILGEVAVHLAPRLSNGWLDRPPARQFTTPTAFVREWIINDAGADDLNGLAIDVDGLAETITDVLVSLRRLDGRHVTLTLRPSNPHGVIDLASGRGLAVPAYLGLGFRHVLGGADHWLFLLGLVNLIGLRRQLPYAATAFTLAHSLTLALAALGVATAPPGLIEALVALSIVFLAKEQLRAIGRPRTITARRPWVMAFAFGLLHGMAFAGALGDIGLPKDARVSALLAFNIGVELAQLAVLGAAAILLLGAQRLAPDVARRAMPQARWAAAQAMGCCAAYWTLARTYAAFGTTPPVF